METLPPPRRRTLWAAGLLCAAGFVCAVVRIGPSRDGGAHIETFVGGLLQDREKECRRSDWWFRGPVDAMARAVVADVPNHPHISAMPFNLKLATTVSPFLPKVYTDVTEIAVVQLRGRKEWLHCREKAEVAPFLASGKLDKCTTYGADEMAASFCPLYHSFAFESSRRSNLLYLDDGGTLVYAAGNNVHFIDLTSASLKQAYLPSVGTGGG